MLLHGQEHKSAPQPAQHTQATAVSSVRLISPSSPDIFCYFLSPSASVLFWDFKDKGEAFSVPSSQADDWRFSYAKSASLLATPALSRALPCTHHPGGPPAWLCCCSQMLCPTTHTGDGAHTYSSRFISGSAFFLLQLQISSP